MYDTRELPRLRHCDESSLSGTVEQYCLYGVVAVYYRTPAVHTTEDVANTGAVLSSKLPGFVLYIPVGYNIARRPAWFAM
jgi:hypothetical protein